MFLLVQGHGHRQLSEGVFPFASLGRPRFFHWSADPPRRSLERYARVTKKAVIRSYTSRWARSSAAEAFAASAFARAVSSLLAPLCLGLSLDASAAGALPTPEEVATLKEKMTAEEERTWLTPYGTGEEMIAYRDWCRKASRRRPCQAALLDTRFDRLNSWAHIRLTLHAGAAR